MEFRAATKAESEYAYTQEKDIMESAGDIGHVRQDFGSSGQEFWTTWWDGCRPDLHTEEFNNDLTSVINRFRDSETADNFLKSRTLMAKYCYSHPEANISGDFRNWVVRADTDKYTYMMRLNPNRGEYNLYCYCYRKDLLNEVLNGPDRELHHKLEPDRIELDPEDLQHHAEPRRDPAESYSPAESAQASNERVMSRESGYEI